MWKEVHDSASNYEPTIRDGAVMFAPAFTRVAHELQVSVPAYLTLHLRDGLVLGVDRSWSRTFAWAEADRVRPTIATCRAA